jgi:GDP-4-dehydro-6-deoxy-D-mannose reductase
MSYRILITGALGFIGRYVINYLAKQNLNCQILCTDLINNAPTDLNFQYSSANLANPHEIDCLVLEFAPTHVVHLAGLVGPGNLEEHLNANVIYTDYLYKAVSNLNPKPIVIQAGSSAAYGWVSPGELPVDEDQPFRPIGPYGFAKATQDLLAESYFRIKDLPIVRARIFNLLGPGQNKNLVPMTFVHQFKEIKDGVSTNIKTGNLAPTRDFVDVRDVAAALFALMVSGEPGEAYNLAGEKEISIEKIINILKHITCLDVRVEIEAKRERALDIMRIYADCSKMKKLTTWTPVIKFKQSITDMWKEVSNGI